MVDILLLAGVAFCALSLVMAVVAVTRTRAPRGAAIAFTVGIVLLMMNAWFGDRPFGVTAVKESGRRFVEGEIWLLMDDVGGPATSAVDSAPSQ